MKVVFIAVNYNTSNLIDDWHDSIMATCFNSVAYLVDNFHSDEEREKVEAICYKRSIELIKSNNNGYGAALNKSINVVKSRYEDCVIVAGNLDVRFIEFEPDLPDGNYVYVCQAIQNAKDRNPFLTKFQSRFLPAFIVPAKWNNILLFRILILILKTLSIIPSKIWAVHGSIFCFNSKILDDMELFNEKTFLYTEELEFASYIERISKSSFISSKIKYEHIGKVATSSILKNQGCFYAYWRLGFSNWRQRW